MTCRKWNKGRRRRAVGNYDARGDCGIPGIRKGPTALLMADERVRVCMCAYWKAIIYNHVYSDVRQSELFLCKLAVPPFGFFFLFFFFSHCNAA